MIANLKIIFLAGFVLLFAPNLLALNSYYSNLAKEFNVYPVKFEFGYPIWYKIHEKPIRGIIYLTNSQEYLEKIGKYTYIGKPTAENAKIIANFSAEPIDFAKYFVIVDSTIIQSEMTQFFDTLAKNEPEMELCFVGSNGKYIPVKYTNWSNLSSDDGLLFCGIRHIFDVLVNSRNQLLLEGNYTELDDIFYEVYSYYSANIFKTDFSIPAPNYRNINWENCTKEISYLLNILEKEPDNNLANYELKKWEYKLKLVEKFKEIQELSSASSYIRLKFQRGASLSFLFKTMNQIQKGIVLTRVNYCKKRFNEDYYQLFKQKKMIWLELLDFTFPDQIVWNDIDYYSVQEKPIEIAPPVSE